MNARHSRSDSTASGASSPADGVGRKQLGQNNPGGQQDADDRAHGAQPVAAEPQPLLARAKLVAACFLQAGDGQRAETDSKEEQQRQQHATQRHPRGGVGDRDADGQRRNPQREVTRKDIVPQRLAPGQDAPPPQPDRHGQDREGRAGSRRGSPEPAGLPEGPWAHPGWQLHSLEAGVERQPDRDQPRPDHQ